MDDREFEQLMKQIGKKLEAERGSFMLNPAAVQKASAIMKKLNEIKVDDTDNEQNIEIGFHVSDLIGYFATITFSFESYGFERKDYKFVSEIINLADSVGSTAGYRPDTVSIDFIINDYIVVLGK